MKKCAVIGLGAFGFHLTKNLYENGHDVIAIDNDKAVVQKIQNFASKAVVADATNKDTLEALDIKSVDIGIVGLGTRLDHSILVTMNLKDLGIKEIMVKAITEEHAKILSLLGVKEVIFPERDIAKRVVTSIMLPNLIDHIPIMEGYSIAEIAAPNEFVGKSLKDLHLRHNYGIQVIAIREVIPERVLMNPPADFVIKNSDIIIAIGENEAISKISPSN